MQTETEVVEDLRNRIKLIDHERERKRGFIEGHIRRFGMIGAIGLAVFACCNLTLGFFDIHWTTMVEVLVFMACASGYTLALRKTRGMRRGIIMTAVLLLTGVMIFIALIAGIKSRTNSLFSGTYEMHINVVLGEIFLLHFVLAVFSMITAIVRTKRIYPGSVSAAVFGTLLALPLLVGFILAFIFIPYDIIIHVPEFQGNPHTTILALLLAGVCLSILGLVILWFVMLLRRNYEWKQKFDGVTKIFTRIYFVLTGLLVIYLVEGLFILKIMAEGMKLTDFFSMLSAASIFAIAIFAVDAAFFGLFSAFPTRKWEKLVEMERGRLVTDVVEE